MHASKTCLDRYAEDAPFSDRHSGSKPGRDSTFGEAHISYMKKIGAVFPRTEARKQNADVLLTSLTPQADVFHAVHCRDLAPKFNIAADPLGRRRHLTLLDP